MYPDAYDRTQRYSVPPEPEILSFPARLREEPESDEGSSPDEGVPTKNVRSPRQRAPHENWSGIRPERLLRWATARVTWEMASWFAGISVNVSIDSSQGLLLEVHFSPWY